MRYKLCLFFAICMLAAAGCLQTSDEKKKQPEQKSDKIQIGMTIDSKVLERWQRDVDTYVETAERMGAEVEVLSANADVNLQISQIEKFISAEKDVITVIAADCDRLAVPLKKAKEKGIKIVAYDRLLNNVDSDLYISFDNEKVGKMMAETMMESLPDGGEIVMVCGPKSDYNAVVIEKSFLNTITGSGLQVVQVEYADGWTPEYAFQTVEEAFEGIDKIDGVMCGNDALAVQAIQALSERRLAGKVCVVGQDADVEACQKIVEGTQTMTVYKPIEELAEKAAEYSVMLAQGIQLTDVRETVDAGKYEAPAKFLEPVPVTKRNMDEVIIGSNFHTKDEVYMNVIPQ